MSYFPLFVVLLVLLLGSGITLAVLFRADRTGLFQRLSAGAYVLFDEEEPPGVPQDQLFAPDDAPTDCHPLTHLPPSDS